MASATPIPTAFAALADPTRYRIVELLRHGPRTVNAIAAHLALHQPQASKHLRHLREAGLVEVHPQAQRRRYTLRPEPLRELSDWIERYRGLWDRRFQGMDALLDDPKAVHPSDGPERKVEP